MNTNQITTAVSELQSVFDDLATQFRIQKLETALQHIAVTLIGARNSADMPRDCVSPMVIKLQIDQALRMIKTVL